MSDDQFTKLFRYMQDFREEVNEKFEQTATSFSEVYDKLDGIAERLDIDETERAAIISQVDRHEGWIKKLGKKTDTDLAVEA